MEEDGAIEAAHSEVKLDAMSDENQARAVLHMRKTKNNHGQASNSDAMPATCFPAPAGIFAKRKLCYRRLTTLLLPRGAVSKRAIFSGVSFAC